MTDEKPTTKPMEASEALMQAFNGDDIDWFKASGHCGHCGLHGDECMCLPEDPCDCRQLHILGAGRLTPSERIEVGLNAFVIDGQDTLL